MVRGVGAQVRGHGLAAQDGVDREMALHRVPTGEQVHREHCGRIAGGVDDVREQLGWEVRQIRLWSHAWPLFRGPAGCHRPGCLHAVARRAPPNAGYGPLSPTENFSLGRKCADSWLRETTAVRSVNKKHIGPGPQVWRGACAGSGGVWWLIARCGCVVGVGWVGPSVSPAQCVVSEWGVSARAAAGNP